MGWSCSLSGFIYRHLYRYMELYADTDAEANGAIALHPFYADFLAKLKSVS